MNEEPLYSLKMRASRVVDGAPQHVSGAEKIVAATELPRYAAALIDRALHHAKGTADSVNVKITAVDRADIVRLPALPVRTVATADAAEGLAAIRRLLATLDIAADAVDAIMAKFRETYAMRGAMLLNVDSLERLEPDRERGVRATNMDGVHDSHAEPPHSKNHFQEAIVLATKVVNAPHIIGEICVSDDPDYVTGYVATAQLGYVRITRLKQPGSPLGGRIFLYRGDSRDVGETIRFLERQLVVVTDVPPAPAPSAPTPATPDPWAPVRDDMARRESQHLRRTMRTLTSPQSSHVAIDGRDLLLLASNNYLGLAADARVIAASQSAAERYGAGSGGSRLTTGTQPPHVELERALADFKGTEAALIFNTGYMANVGIVGALGSLGATVFSDELNHASLIDGCRLGRAQTVVYRHNDMGDLEAKIRAAAPAFGVIVSDAVFSMDGDVARLPELLALADRYGLLTMLDEAHSTGVLGQTGRGIAEHFHLSRQPDILMGTLSKSLGSVGGYVCGSRLLCDWLANAARSFIYSTSLPASAIAAARESLRILVDEPSLVQRLRANTRTFIDALRGRGVDVADSESAIVPIIIGDEQRAVDVAERLYARGLCLGAIRYPTVARGQARLRAAIMATHTADELRHAAAVIADSLRELP